ncbi:hypothetical protein SGA01_46180 [Streptomyces gardneri]|uniref:Uncharacterized protein n=1 Tax=Streptomyces gardneri TaxID=66892 RepID=A0A4Y3RQM1_9ACTN|nr:hypothetical protein SGA01_46180 [Streptomyces gardneri]
MMVANSPPDAHPDATVFRDSIEPAGLGPAVRARTRAGTGRHAMLLRVRIQKNASGRPGPAPSRGGIRPPGM